MTDSWQLEIATLRGDITILDATSASGVKFERYVTGKTGSLTATLTAPNRSQAEKLQAIARDDATLTLGCYLRRGRDLWGGFRLDDADVTLNARGGTTISISGTTLEGYLDDRTWDTTTTWTNIEQLEIARQIWQAALAAEGDLGIDVPAVTASGMKRDLAVARSDNRTLRSLLDEISNRVGGFEWMINTYLVDAVRHRELLLGYPTISRSTSDVLSFPGQLLTFNRKISRNGGGTRFWARGSAPDDVSGDPQLPLLSPILRSEDLLAAKAVLIDNVLDETDVKIQATLNARGVGHQQMHAGVRTYVKATARVQDVTAGMLGSNVLLRVSDPIYPAGPNGAPGLESRHRVIGLSVTPDERGQSEIAELLFEEAP